jgi:hypothetical protein
METKDAPGTHGVHYRDKPFIKDGVPISGY